MLVTPPQIRIRDPYEGAPPLSRLLEELQPALGDGAYALTETARDLDAFIDLHEGEPCNVHENRRRLRTAPTEFTASVPALRATLERLLQLIRRADHSAVDLREIAARAHEVAIWAESLEAVATALTFAQLAQEVDEDSGTSDPQFAFDLGRIAATLPEHREAGVAWLVQAAGQARALGRDDLAERAAALAAELRSHVGEAA